MSVTLDFSFKGATSLADLASEEPRNWDGKAEKVETSCLKFDENNFESVDGLGSLLKQIVSEPLKITWIDFSCNLITRIEPELLSLSGLQVLYLHGNQIGHLKEIEKLKSLPSIRSLTMHGNPVAEKKEYRVTAVASCPNLRSLDFAGVTRRDHESAARTVADLLRRQRKK